MPVGIQRINAKKSQPNPHIVFIKPLQGPDEAVAQEFLEKIAAQCLPVMRENHIHVMSLEEFPANREFVGRNFNAGEVIQLVLKSPGSGRWLPFNYVQMVMMHELAHCKQMNHTKAFWAVRNQYAAQMRELWAKGYRGDGIWGRGAMLGSGAWEGNVVKVGDVLPENLCGGTYRSRAKKRKPKTELTYQEKKERRILKKFGKNGVALGADEETKVKLEKGKRIQAKPRVASSARGRDLRAAAALARFEKSAEESKPLFQNEELQSSEGESKSNLEGPQSDLACAADIDGKRLVDKDGQDFIKICEDEHPHDAEVKDEFSQLQDLLGMGWLRREPGASQKAANARSSISSRSSPTLKPDAVHQVKKEEIQQKDEAPNLEAIPQIIPQRRNRADHVFSNPQPCPLSKSNGLAPASSLSEARPVSSCGKNDCLSCSYANERSAVVCAVCANVLNPGNTPGSWKCSEAPCFASNTYTNSADCGACNVCGRKRAASVEVFDV